MAKKVCRSCGRIKDGGAWKEPQEVKEKTKEVIWTFCPNCKNGE